MLSSLTLASKLQNRGYFVPGTTFDEAIRGTPSLDHLIANQWDTERPPRAQIPVPGLFLSRPASQTNRDTAVRYLELADFDGVQFVCDAVKPMRDVDDIVPNLLQAARDDSTEISRLRAWIDEQNRIIQRLSSGQSSVNIRRAGTRNAHPQPDARAQAIVRAQAIARAQATITSFQRAINTHYSNRRRSLGQITDTANSKGFEWSQAFDMISHVQTDYISKLCESLEDRYSLAGKALVDACTPLRVYRQTGNQQSLSNAFARFLAAVVDMAGPEDEDSDSESEGESD